MLHTGYETHGPHSQEENIRGNLLGNYMQLQFTSPDVTNSGSQETNIPKNKDQPIPNGKLKNDASIPKEVNYEISAVVFKKQPPDNLRKSNFFHFDLSFYDSNGNNIIIEKASFLGFQEEKEDKPLRNGIKYKMNLLLHNGKKHFDEILVRLIDSASKKPISYDGQDKNPDMCRVLLTHEVMCSRCCESKSCGNRNETPSDPVVLANGSIARYHMKCNQNCLKNAGNPRETRRFQVQVSLLKREEIIPLATSENMFVHNNSKHGRRPGSVCDSSISSPCSDISSKLPIIHHIIPKEGKLAGCDEAAIVGENFFEGIQIAFGNQIAYRTEVLTSNIIRVITPPCTGAIVVDVKCVHGCRIVQRGSSPNFKYNTELYDSQIDFYVERLWNVIPKQPTDIEKPTKEIILRRALEVFEYLYSNGSPFYNPYENGYESIAQNQTGIQQRMLGNISGNAISAATVQAAIQGNSISGKEKISNNNGKTINSTDTGMEHMPSATDYVRHAAVVTNPHHHGYENLAGANGYVMGPVLVGMNQICEGMPTSNPANFYIPYGNEHPNNISVNFPIKRSF